MAGSLNEATIMGHLGRDPEVRSMPGGGKVANLSVATSEDWKDKSTGERKSRTEWHRITVFDERLVTLCESYLRKGSKLWLRGQLETRKYQKDGQDHYSTEIVLRPFSGKIQLLDSRQGDADRGEASERPSAAPAGFARQPPSSRGGDLDDDLDQIPF